MHGREGEKTTLRGSPARRVVHPTPSRAQVTWRGGRTPFSFLFLLSSPPFCLLPSPDWRPGNHFRLAPAYHFNMIGARPPWRMVCPFFPFFLLCLHLRYHTGEYLGRSFR